MRVFVRGDCYRNDLRVRTEVFYEGKLYLKGMFTFMRVRVLDDIAGECITQGLRCISIDR